MSHKILGGLALSAAIGFSGASQAGQTANDVSSPVTALKKLVAIEGNDVIIQSCMSELDMPYKTYPQDNRMHAQIVVDCADQKSLDRFIFDPSVKRQEIALLVERHGYENTASRIKKDVDFAKKVVAECRAEEKILSDDFAECAGDKHEIAERANNLGLIPLSICFLSLNAAMILASRRQQNHPRNELV